MLRALFRVAPGARGFGRQFAFLALIGVVSLALIALVAFRWASGHARANADQAAAQMARASAGLLASELQKFRLLPVVLTEYPDVSAVLQQTNPSAVARLNGKLELLARRTDAAVIYLIAADGRTIAASNSRLPTSFVGQNYGFRPYFREAISSGRAELFALGTVSGRPGLYIARRIEADGRTLGVIVVKVEFDRIETEWARQPGPSFVTDAHGVIIITSRPEWRFHTMRLLDDSIRAQIRRTVQFGGLALTPLGLAREGATVSDSKTRYREAEVAVPMAGGRLRFLQPLAPMEASANATARVAILIALVVVIIVLGLVFRAREKRRLQTEGQRALEREVVSRTAELRAANDELGRESRERETLSARYRAAREELAQASRLGSIGQITAGVAHEINQPVAAIRTFAENARTYLDRDEPANARDNLNTIVELTARIGGITSELRTFARRSTPVVGEELVGPVIDGALMLIGDRVRTSSVRLHRTGKETGLRVAADRVRLEQIIINLLQNALDALEGREDKQIHIETRAEGRHVIIEISDNGPGIPADIANEIFTPFVTGRSDGLGLGLGIARDIVREFGGRLDIVKSGLGGAAFRITLRHP